MPDFYQMTANYPATNATTNSHNMQAEFELIEAAMAKLAPYTGHADELVLINADGTGYTSVEVVPADSITGINASVFTTGILDLSFIPDLPASKITTGMFGEDRIPDLDRAKFTGDFGQGQIPKLSPSKIDLKASKSRSANYAVPAGDRGKTILVNATGGARTITLPNLSGSDNGFTVQVMKTDDSANAVTLDGNGNDTINGAATQKLTTQYQAVTLEWDGSAWFLFAGGRKHAYA